MPRTASLFIVTPACDGAIQERFIEKSFADDDGARRAAGQGKS
jgi:hypothetical protein